MRPLIVDFEFKGSERHGSRHAFSLFVGTSAHTESRKGVPLPERGPPVPRFTAWRMKSNDLLRESSEGLEGTYEYHVATCLEIASEFLKLSIGKSLEGVCS